jgi:hypothetical protein
MYQRVYSTDYGITYLLCNGECTPTVDLQVGAYSLT